MKNRDLNIDLIKICAMFAVIMLHTSVCFNNLSNYLIAYIMRTIGLMGVPLFFTVSGYLLMGRKHISYSYSFSKIYNICRYVLVFSILYWILVSIHAHELSIKYFVYGASTSLINRGFFPWFWYFGAMIIIYLILPIYNNLYNKHTFMGGNSTIIHSCNTMVNLLICLK